MQDFNVKDYVYQVWSRRWLVLAFFLSSVLFVGLWTFQQTRIYRASTTIEIGSETPDAAFFQDVLNTSPYGWWSAMRYYETQYQIIKSRDLLSKAAERAIEQNLFRGSAYTVEQVTSILQGGLSIESDDSSRLAKLHFDASNPKLAQQLSILISETYIDENLAKKMRGVGDAITWLNARLKEVRVEKRERESELQDKKKEFKIVSIPGKESLAQSDIEALAQALNRLKSQRIEIQAKYFKLKELVKKSKSTEDLFGVVSNDLLKSLNEELAQLKAKKNQLSSKYLKKHPSVVQTQNEINELNKLIEQEVSNEVNRLRTRYLLAQAEERSIAKALDAQKLVALQVEEVNQDIRDIELINNTNQQIYETLLRKLKEADLSSLVRSNNIRIVDRALLPGGPIRPNVNRNLLLAIIIGAIGGIGLALLLEQVNDTIQSIEDLEQYVKVPFLGIVPHVEGDGAGEKKGFMAQMEAKLSGKNEDPVREIAFYPLSEPSAVASEFYRTIRTNLLFLDRVKPKGNKRFLFVSTGPGEGKTVTAVNVAVTLSQLDKKVIVVDLDFRRPKIHTIIGAEKYRGITNVLLNELELEEAIVRHEESKIDFLPCGSIPPNPSELMSSAEIRSLLAKLDEEYDYVVLDSSPIAPVTDALIASQFVDGVIMVVRSGKTQRKAAQHAARQLESVETDVLGTILNDVDVQKSTYGKYQYYAYGYKGYANAAPKNEDSDENLHLN